MTLSHGWSYFGEMALMNDEARQASVSAKGKVECFMLERKQFELLLGPLADLMRRSVQERQDQNAALATTSNVRYVRDARRARARVYSCCRPDDNLCAAASKIWR